MMSPGGRSHPRGHALPAADDVARRRDHGTRRFQLSHLGAPTQRIVQLDRDVEMILQRALATAGDEDELLDPGGPGLLDRILDERLVDDRQHLLRDRLGRRQETGAEPGHRKDRLAQWFHPRTPAEGRHRTVIMRGTTNGIDVP
jgi:hypothetical protein